MPPRETQSRLTQSQRSHILPLVPETKALSSSADSSVSYGTKTLRDLHTPRCAPVYYFPVIPFHQDTYRPLVRRRNSGSGRWINNTFGPGHRTEETRTLKRVDIVSQLFSLTILLSCSIISISESSLVISSKLIIITNKVETGQTHDLNRQCSDVRDIINIPIVNTLCDELRGRVGDRRLPSTERTTLGLRLKLGSSNQSVSDNPTSGSPGKTLRRDEKSRGLFFTSDKRVPKWEMSLPV